MNPAACRRLARSMIRSGSTAEAVRHALGHGSRAMTEQYAHHTGTIALDEYGTLAVEPDGTGEGGEKP